MRIGRSLVDSRRDGDLKEVESDVKCTLIGLYNGSKRGGKEVDEWWMVGSG